MLARNHYIWGVGLAVMFLVMVGAGTGLGQEPGAGLLPTVRLLIPNLSQDAYRAVPASFGFQIDAVDPDTPGGRPVKVRFLLIPAVIDTSTQGEPIYITTRSMYEQYGPGLIAWDDPNWSEWTDYEVAPDLPSISFSGLEDNVYYLLALQALDADGAVSTGRGYQEEVYHLRTVTSYFRPEVTLCEPYLGCPSATVSRHEIASGQPLNFTWIADAQSYGGTIASYRHGWDLVDPDDPNDPGWAVAPGLSPENLFAQERKFNSGFHNFYLRVEDNSGQVRLMIRQLPVIPFVDRPFQLPLLVLDQTVDNISNAWLDQSGVPRDNETYRNAFWQFLGAGSGGVSGFNLERDWRHHYDQVAFSDLVQYQAVMCYARAQQDQLLFQQFRPAGDKDKYVWLAPYQQQGGNYFQVGDGSMDSFLEILPNYMIPVIFDTDETSYVWMGVNYKIGFGHTTLPDGTVVSRGPAMYPFATAGIAALDWTAPNGKNIYGRPDQARYDRHVDCNGLKGLVLDPDFRANHGVVVGAIADTFLTEAVIDWQDALAAEAGTLNLFNGTFLFRNDEFVDANLSSRMTPIIPQTCAEGPAGRCVEPMFTGLARMDWMREEKHAAGDPDWPASTYTVWELEDGCGDYGLTSHEGIPRSSAPTNEQVFGYLSYKNVVDKPGGKADVYWGFDPYRFDQNEAKKAIRWVLGYFGMNINP